MEVTGVFLSSTAKDLSEYRDAVFRAIDSLGKFKCIRMETFGARTSATLKVCATELRRCDLFIGILGWCYGSCPPGRTKSYSELEFEAAEKAKLPMLVFLAPEDFPMPAALIEPLSKRKQQIAFRNRVIRKMLLGRFTSPSDLARDVLQAINNWKDEQQAPIPDGEALSGVNLFQRSGSSAFTASISNLMLSSKRVIMIGTGLDILADLDFVKKLFVRCQAQLCEVEIYLANPFSLSVEQRLVEEEAGALWPTALRPPIGREGLIKRIRMLNNLHNAEGADASFQLKLFNQYPTFALIILDEHIFAYHYAYALLGNESPVLHYRLTRPSHSAMCAHYLDHAARVRADSIPVSGEYVFHNQLPIHRRDLHSFAVFIVPAAGHPLYNFCNSILGYDLRTGADVASGLSKYAGAAQKYGAHVTVCDALYYSTKAQKNRAIEEVEFLARDISHFSLGDLNVMKKFPDESSIGISLTEETGYLELLHSELVIRIYRSSLASEYTFDRRRASRSDDILRTNVMMNRYRAPYVLGRFLPHITLLSSVDENHIDAVYIEIEHQFQTEMRSTKTCSVESICIMAYNDRDERWYIEREIPLGGHPR